MEFVDTHCHIQFADYPIEQGQVLADAAESGITQMLAVGCSLPDSQAAIALAAKHNNVWASVGLHPHEGARYVHDHHALQQFRQLATQPRVVAIGETGLDYYYENSPKADQQKLLRFQLDLATEHNLPLILHIRDAFDDFWTIFDQYKEIRGVVHSFNSVVKDLEQILTRGLYVGLNGIMTFTKQADQLEAAKAVPLEKLLLETDAPYLTPVPFRGTICEPKHVRTVGEFLADLRGENLLDLATATTANAKRLFKL
ncbi:MAG: TatD family hydrolase [bacterium]|nr:TatD family hydrolase [bacterium]